MIKMSHLELVTSLILCTLTSCGFLYESHLEACLLMLEKYINLMVILYVHLYNLGSVYLRWGKDGKSQWQCTHAAKQYLPDMVESLHTGAHRACDCMHQI